jgi:hypothetical protein
VVPEPTARDPHPLDPQPRPAEQPPRAEPEPPRAELEPKPEEPVSPSLPSEQPTLEQATLEQAAVEEAEPVDVHAVVDDLIAPAGGEAIVDAEVVDEPRPPEPPSDER